MKVYVAMRRVNWEKVACAAA